MGRAKSRTSPSGDTAHSASRKPVRTGDPGYAPRMAIRADGAGVGADPTAGVVATDVHRSFGAVRAINGVNLTARKGAVTALIGPNAVSYTHLTLPTILR